MGKIQQSFNTALGSIGALSIHYQRVASENLKKLQKAKAQQLKAEQEMRAKLNEARRKKYAENKIENQDVKIGGQVLKAGELFNKQQLKELKEAMKNGK